MFRTSNQNKGLIRPHHSSLLALCWLLDAATVGLMLHAIAWILDVRFSQSYTILMWVSIGAFFFFAELRGVYQSWRVSRLIDEAKRVWATWGSVVLAVVVLGFLTKTSTEYSRRVMLSWFLFTPFVLAGWRVVMRSLLRSLRQYGANTRTVAVVGTGQLADHTGRTIHKNAWMGLQLLGFYDDEPSTEERRRQQTGSIDDLVRKAHSGEVDHVYMALPMKEEDKMMDVVAKLGDTTVSVFFVPDLFVFDLLHGTVGSLDGIPAISVYESPFDGLSGLVKRIEDIILASVILAVIAIPMLFIALGVKLTSRGPVLFKQHRYGVGGDPIRVWKFRTMSVCEDDANITQAQKNDVRVTKFGAFLRRTSLDELPQFINVLQGKMSIVGPRPHAVAHNEKYRKLIHGYMLRHKVKPGITGWAQINGWRGETETLEKMEKRVEFDLEYIKIWSIWLDLKIILLTMFKGFRDKAAY